jgi:hypothetical protein
LEEINRRGDSDNIHSSLFTVQLNRIQSSITMTTVAVIALNGNLANSILSALTGPLFRSHFSLPIRGITRNLSTVKHNLDGVTYIEANELASYQKALDGVDVVIDLRGVAGLPNNDVIEAAANCGVKLYLNSEFGSDYHRCKKYSVAFKRKEDSANFARSKGLKVVEMITGYFIDTTLNSFYNLVFIDPENAICDSPELDKPTISVTSIRDIGLSVASVVSKNPKDLPDHIRLAGDNVTPGHVAAIYEKATGRKVTRKPRKLDDLVKLADQHVANQVFRYPEFFDILRAMTLISDVGDFSKNCDNGFVNPGLFEWESFEQYAIKQWSERH